MDVNATHTPADMVVLSLRIWLQMPHIIQQLWLCYLCGYGCECHTYSSRYGCVILKDNGCECHTYSSRYGRVILKDMAANATLTPADMVVLSFRIMAVNATHTQADMVVLSLRKWLQMPHILQQIWLCYPCGYGCECHTFSSRYGCVILKDMVANATHSPADMVVLSLWIWL